MGLFDKVKAMKNAITGGAAEIELTSTSAQMGEQFEIILTAYVRDADVKISRAYIRIDGREEVEMPYTETDSDDSHNSREVARSSTSTFELELIVADAQVLSANKKYEWKVSAQIPENSLPAYEGNYCNHFYRARGFLDCFGNDPDSGWKHIEVK